MLVAHALMVVVAAGAVEPIPPPPPDGGLRVESNRLVELDDGGLTADAGLLNASAAAPSLKVPLRFKNNKVMAEEVYRAMLDLPRDAGVNRATAYTVRTQIEAFLHRCGYELATVSTAIDTPDGGSPAIEVDINEGLLEKVVFRGKFTFKTLRFKLALQLPYDIFNRPELERQIRALTQELDLGRVWYELVPTREVKHLAPQVDSLGSLGEIQGYELIHPREPYELHIFFEEKNWDVGSWLDIRTGPIDGLELIGVDQGQGFLAPDDRFRLSISGGGGLRNPIADPADPKRLFLVPELYPTFSRAYGEAIYYAAVPYIRPKVEARSELVSRQRKDLYVENYFNLNADALISAEYELARKQTITFGLGERYQRVFDVTGGPGGLSAGPSQGEYVQEITALEDNTRLFRSFAELRLDLLFADGNDRYDRRHELTVEARQFLSGEVKAFGEARVSWQRVFPFGWDDLWIKGYGAFLYGEVPFTSQEPVNDHLRNVFGPLYVDDIASESTEIRFSITRDIFKVSFFNDLAAFGYPQQLSGVGSLRFPAGPPRLPFTQRPPGLPAFNSGSGSAANLAQFPPQELEVGDAFGPGMHFLIGGMFQVDMYYAIGLSTVQNYHFDNGFSLNLQKVF